MRFLAVLFGIILLLPGACALLVMVVKLTEMFRGGGSHSDPSGLIFLWAFCFAISLVGHLMIWSGTGE